MLLQENQAARQAAANERRRLIPVEEHRAIRMSLESAVVLAARYGASDQTIQRIRRGRTGGELLRDEKRAAQQRSRPTGYALPAETLLFVGHLFGGVGDEGPQEAQDAAHECACGRLPWDSSPACGHWPQERSAA